MLIYVDTNIYLDFLLDRSSTSADFSLASYNLFIRTAACEFTIIISDHVLRELARHVKAEETEALFSFIKPKIVTIQTMQEDVQNATKALTHYSDALHIALAKRCNASCIVTRNTKDFASWFKTKLPEEL